MSAALERTVDAGQYRGEATLGVIEASAGPSPSTWIWRLSGHTAAAALSRAAAAARTASARQAAYRCRATCGRGTHRGVLNSPAGELQPTGKSMQVNFCDVYRLKHGKIVRADSYFDFYGLLKQLAPEKLA